MSNNPWLDSDKMITFAEESTAPPPEPTAGIPKQKVPGWVRWPIRAIFLPFVLLDITLQKVVRKFFKTPYIEQGGCNQRGNCCYFILIPSPKTFMTKLYYWWHTEINGFYSRQPKPIVVAGEELTVLGCRYLQKDGRCGHYRMRPTICREWPQIEYFGRPKILRGCGYRAVPRDPNFDPFPQETDTSENKLNIID